MHIVENNYHAWWLLVRRINFPRTISSVNQRKVVTVACDGIVICVFVCFGRCVFPWTRFCLLSCHLVRSLLGNKYKRIWESRNLLFWSFAMNYASFNFVHLLTPRAALKLIILAFISFPYLGEFVCRRDAFSLVNFSCFLTSENEYFHCRRTGAEWSTGNPPSRHPIGH